ncbi:MAG: CaiB/BaiF CoA-transferase family protein [Actinomycetota bacterium]|nr:CaiB/BaiF CoA-transferase family protein [Actinomycetota bacterium]
MSGPMEGYRVLEMSQIVTGPLATMLLADQGADVVKVEPISGGDATRRGAYMRAGIATLFANNNRGKRSLAVDLHHAKGREVVLELAAQSDVVVQNFRPGACDRLGVGYGDVQSVNPDVVYLSISGYGPTGPYADRPVLDPVIQGLAGVVSRQLNPDIPFPDLVRNIIADKSTALIAAQAVTAALLVRERGGGGQHIQLAMLDALLYFFWPDGMMDVTYIGEDVGPGLTLAQLYRLTDCSDGKIVYFAASDRHLKGLFRAAGHPEWCEDERFSRDSLVTVPENFELLGSMLTTAFAEITVDEALAGLVAEDVPAGPILGSEQVFSDPQVIHNETLATWEHPDLGLIRQPRPAPRFSAGETPIREEIPHLGQHTDEILGELGRDADAITILRDEGVIL